MLRLTESKDVFFIVSGKVRATMYSRSGKEVSFRDLGPGKMFGELSAIDDKPRSVDVMALTDAFILSMPAKDFWQSLQDYPLVTAATLRDLTSLVRHLSERIIEFSTLGVKNRIHAELLRLARENMQGDRIATISPAPTHADIASRVSTHREAVTRELNHLAHAGLIERERGALVVRDVNRLVQMVHDVRGE